MRVLFVTEHFPPSTAIAARRASALARHLATLGWQVDVLAASLPETGTLASGSAPRGMGPRVARVPDPALRLPRSVRILAAKFVPPDGSVFWSLRLASQDVVKPDVIVASGPPFSVFIAAACLARRQDVPWVADYRDLWTLSGYFPYSNARRRLERRLEHRLLQGCVGAMSVSAPLVDSLSVAFNVPAIEVRNGFEPSEFEGLNRWKPTAGPLRIVYCGEIYEGKRDPSPLFEAISRLGLTEADISVEFYGNTVGQVRSIARRFDVESVVKVRPAVPHRQSLEIQSAADVLLLLLWDSPDERGVYSGKLFEYIGARRPVLLIGYGSGVAADLVRSGYGWVPSPADVPDILVQALREKRAGGPFFKGGNPNEHAYERQARRVDTWLRTVATARG